jgi:hypothetical protein
MRSVVVRSVRFTYIIIIIIIIIIRVTAIRRMRSAGCVQTTGMMNE